VLGTGSALPGEAVASETLVDIMAARFGFSGARKALAVAERLGVTHRHIARRFDAATEEAAPGHSNPELAAAAVRAALVSAGLEVGAIGYLIAHTATPAQLLPGNVAIVADLIGYAWPHVELRQACTGFANALMIAAGLIAASDRPVVIVGSETGSLFLDPRALDEDGGQIVNLVQMGDGAGAIVLGRPEGAPAQIEAAWFGAVGLGRAPGISQVQGARHFDHHFQAVRTSGVRLFEAGWAAAAALECPADAADWIIPHQASGRIGAQLSSHFALGQARTFVNADRLGNTGSAAIWLALDALRRGPLRAGERAVVLGAEATKHMYGGFAYAHG